MGGATVSSISTRWAEAERKATNLEISIPVKAYACRRGLWRTRPTSSRTEAERTIVWPFSRTASRRARARPVALWFARTRIAESKAILTAGLYNGSHAANRFIHNLFLLVFGNSLGPSIDFGEMAPQRRRHGALLLRCRSFVRLVGLNANRLAILQGAAQHLLHGP